MLFIHEVNPYNGFPICRGYCTYLLIEFFFSSGKVELVLGTFMERKKTVDSIDSCDF